MPTVFSFFAATDALTHLASKSCWYMDGNFKVAPAIFKQLYVVRAKLDAGAVTCVYCLLPGKGGILYNELFTVIQRKMQQLNLPIHLTEVSVDFEMAAYNAIRMVFGPLISIGGCFYHLTQSTYRKACELGLKQLIDTGTPQNPNPHYRPDLRQFAAMIDALAFLPPAQVQIGVMVLYRNIPDPIIRPLLDYFYDTYVAGPPLPNQPMMRAQPLFPIAIWNKYDITLRGADRTNNICEGWNMASSNF